MRDSLAHLAMYQQRIRVQKISRWSLAPVVVARTVAIAIRLILKLDLDEALDYHISRLLRILRLFYCEVFPVLALSLRIRILFPAAWGEFSNLYSSIAAAVLLCCSYARPSK